MTTDTDTYNGWKNRETWAVNLHLSNDEGLYLMAQQLADETPDLYDRAEAFESWIDELYEYADEGNDALRMMFNDIGSLWRVDWHDIAGAWPPDESE